MLASEIRRRRVRGLRGLCWRRHLDEVLVQVKGEPHEFWRAVEHEGEGLEVYVSQPRDKPCDKPCDKPRDKPCDKPCDEAAALGVLRKPMRRHGRAEELVTDKELVADQLRLVGGASRRGRGSASGR